MALPRKIRVTAVCLVVAAGLALAAGTSQARPAKGAQEVAKSAQVTINMLSLAGHKPAWEVLIGNFERVYPNIKVNITYAATDPQLWQLETTQIAAGNAPDVLYVIPGAGAVPVSVGTLARSGALAPMVRRPWTKRLLSIVASADKVGKNLYAFSPGVSIFGVFTNDTLFNKLGLKVPQTFPQLLNVCRKAHAAGVTAYLLPGATQANIGNVIVNAAVATVYGQDPKWKSEREADKVTFAGSAGWRAALQELIDMNNANCFQPGYVGAVNPGVVAAFSQGQGLMIAGVSGLYASLKLANPSFAWSMHPWPASNDTKGKTAFVNLEYALAVSAKSVHPKEAQEFVDFIARPKQDELFSKILGWFTQNQFAKGDVPGWMSSIRPVLTQKRWAVNPQELWWNPSIQLALYTNEIGILTGQRSVDDVLKAMDDAFNKGPQ